MGSAYFTFLPAPLCVFIMSVFNGHCHKEGRCWEPDSPLSRFVPVKILSLEVIMFGEFVEFAKWLRACGINRIAN